MKVKKVGQCTKENATLDTLQMALLIYFVAGLVTIPILYWRFVEKLPKVAVTGAKQGQEDER